MGNDIEIINKFGRFLKTKLYNCEGFYVLDDNGKQLPIDKNWDKTLGISVKTINSCRNPLELTKDTLTTKYRVNKQGDQSGLYVSKKVADDLLIALSDIRARIMIDDPEFNLPIANEAIDNAIKYD